MKIKQMVDLVDTWQLGGKRCVIEKKRGTIIGVGYTTFRFSLEGSSDDHCIFYSCLNDGEKDIYFIDEINLQFKTDIKEEVFVKDCKKGDYVEFEGQKGFISRSNIYNEHSLICFDVKDGYIGWEVEERKKDVEREDLLGKKYAWYIKNNKKVKFIAPASMMGVIDCFDTKFKGREFNGIILDEWGSLPQKTPIKDYLLTKKET